MTNRHVVEDDSDGLIGISTQEHGYQPARVEGYHPILDIAFLDMVGSLTYNPIAIGNSDEVRVGDQIIAIGYPYIRDSRARPTVSQGIISAIRDGELQTDAALNPGNSGGPLLDRYGRVIGIVFSKLSFSPDGFPLDGLGFAIPINEVKTELGDQVSPSGSVLSTPTSFPAIGPTPDLEATKSAIEAIDAFRRASDQATQAAVEAQATAEQYAADLEATRIAELPTPTPTATPTATPTPMPTSTSTPTPTPEPTPTFTPIPTPTPTPTPHPRTFCQEWEALVLEWIKDGNDYPAGIDYVRGNSNVPNHPNLSAREAGGLCLTSFPRGVLAEQGNYSYYSSSPRYGLTVGYGEGNLLPGLYEYRRAGDDRVEAYCAIYLNTYSDNSSSVELPYGETFTFQFYEYHERISFSGSCNGALYRIGD